MPRLAKILSLWGPMLGQLTLILENINRSTRVLVPDIGHAKQIGVFQPSLAMLRHEMFLNFWANYSH